MSHKGHSIVTIESLDSGFEPRTYKQTSPLDYFTDTLLLVRPYFRVANRRLPHRVLSSMAPPLFFPEFRRVYSDLKGPLLIMVSLASILLYGLYSPERTLMWDIAATAKLTVGYWLGLSVLAFFLGYFCQTNLTLPQFLSITGYSLTGHCLVLLIAEVLHQEENHGVFFFLTTVFGGLATGRLVIIILARTPGPAQRLVMCSVLACVNLMHLIYIHFACMRNKFQI
ncbi:protein YIPF3-like [Penaeus chinensis]|uniref:protein YIPF3-like n=1 Tax=Penaeus chinensis TaxID=139456 RepID=UPI001FB854B6|nr:protein YIPF3-like [Penaeus chinensis]